MKCQVLLRNACLVGIQILHLHQGAFPLTGRQKDVNVKFVYRRSYRVGISRLKDASPGGKQFRNVRASLKQLIQHSEMIPMKICMTHIERSRGLAWYILLGLSGHIDPCCT